MTTVYKPLGQVTVVKGEPTTLYDIPEGKEIVIRSINITNPTNFSQTYSIAFTPTISEVGSFQPAFLGADIYNGAYKISTDLVSWNLHYEDYVSIAHDGVGNAETKQLDYVNGIFFDLPQYSPAASFQASTDGVRWRTYPVSFDGSSYNFHKVIYRERTDTYFLIGQYELLEFTFDPTKEGIEIVSASSYYFPRINLPYFGDYTYGLNDRFKVQYSPSADVFVAILDQQGSPYGFQYGIITSTDGYTWEDNGVGNISWPGYWDTGALELVHDYFVVVSNSYADYWVAYSKDGYTWNQMWWPYDNDFINFGQIAYNENKMVLQSDSNNYYQVADITPTNLNMFIKPAGAIGGWPAGYMFSTDGINWQNSYISGWWYNDGYSLHNNGTAVENDYSVAGNGWISLIGLANPDSYTTHDGTTWVKNNMDSYALFQPSSTINYNTGEVAMLYWQDDAGYWYIQTSTDGINWKAPQVDFGLYDFPYSENFQKIAYGSNDYFDGYIITSTDSSNLFVSTDLTTWDIIGVDFYPTSINFDPSNGQFIINTNGDFVILTNPYDSTTFNYIGVGIPDTTKIIIGPNGLYLAIDNNTTDIATSEDYGQNWYPTYLPMDPFWSYAGDYNPANGIFALSSPDYSIYSTDGYTWSFSNVSYPNNNSWGGVSYSTTMSHATFANSRPLWNFNDGNRQYTSNNYHTGEGAGANLVYGNGLWYWVEQGANYSNTKSTDLITWTWIPGDFGISNEYGQSWLATFGNALVKPKIPKSDYIAYNANIDAGQTITIKSAYTVNGGNSIVVDGSDQIGFAAFGAEIV